MKLNLVVDKGNPSLGLYAATQFLAADKELQVSWGKETKATWSSGSASSPSTILRILGRKSCDVSSGSTINLYLSSPLEKSQVDHWMAFSDDQLNKEEGWKYLEDSLKNSSYLVADRVTIADLAMFDKLSAQKSELEKFQNIRRYFLFIEGIIKNTIPFKDGGNKDELKRLEIGAGDNISVGKQAVSDTNTDKNAAAKKQGSKKEQGGGGGNQKKPIGAGGKENSSSGKKDTNKNDNAGGGDKGKRKEEGKFVELPGAEMGKVVVRFPPEASGYLHIGHAKAALLNQYYQTIFQGKLIMRFDDTNPAKEKEHFEDVILEDLKLLEIKPDRFTYSSDSFDLMLQYCEKLIKESKAYVDDTDGDIMRDERIKRIESKNRSNSVEKNLKMWDEMKKGTVLGQKCCVRAKIDMNSNNGCMRDPTIYRCKPEAHPRTGDKYKVYPTYDFTCPIVDSIEGVTHALRTTEYHDRDDQYFWFIDALGLRKPWIYEYSRLNLTNTVLSKRKLTWFVDEGLVDGWDDPRMPTVRGVLRRGMTVEGLKQFIVAQGSSRSVVMMGWDKIWSFNRQIIDPIAPRHTALMKDNLVTVFVNDATEKLTQSQAHPKNPEIGSRNTWISNKILVEEDDAILFKEGENVTFVNWGNLKITKITKTGDKITRIDASQNLEDTNFKNTIKVTWLADTPKTALTPIDAVFYDHIISKAIVNPDEDFKQFIGKNTKINAEMVGDEDLKKLKKGDIIQLQRKGFFICDVPYKPRSVHTCKESPIVLFAIPDGKDKVLPTIKIPGKQVESGADKSAGDSKGRSLAAIDSAIIAQGNKIRDLKTQKAAKDIIDPAVKELLALKVEFKAAAGKEWDPKGNNVPTTSAPVASSPTSNPLAKIDAEILAQGNKIRDLKAQKAAKDIIDPAVKQLLALKDQFKEVAGKAWDPKGNNVPTTAAAPPVASSPVSNPLAKIDSEILAQGNKIRDLKAQKAAKEVIDPAVKQLLALKDQFKEVAGKAWDPKGNNVPTTSAPVASSPTSNPLAKIDAEILAQGNKIRDLKAQKAAKDIIDPAVKQLLALKDQFKEVAGKAWDPKGNNVPTTAAAPPVASSPISNPLAKIDSEILAQGNKIRDLKAQKAAKNIIEPAVKELLALKEQFKEVAGKQWDPKGNNVQKSSSESAKPASPATKMGDNKSEIASKIEEQGNNVRQLKDQKAPKDQVDSAVKLLLELKAQYKTATGEEYAAPGAGPRKQKEQKPAKAAAPPKEKEAPTDGKKQTKLGIDTKKSENLSDWYSQVITKGEMIEYYDVSGCYIFRPWSFAIWEAIKEWFDAEIKKLGVQNCYFPMFVSQAALQKEKDHIADFAPEVAWVTKSGDSDLAEPIAIRPTSETVMYPSFSKWVQSYRDLPIKLNQWNNVVRWEFKSPQPFIRTREFLWQEGHTAFATKEEAEEEVMQILDLYAKIYTDLLAMPVIPGRKTEKEKFPGGDYTTTVEAFISASGRGLQGATSHHLGQNFSKMFHIEFEDPVDRNNKEKLKAYQNSWGLSTRTIGAMVLAHGDDQGLVLPPRVAAIQVVIVPCGITASTSDKDRDTLLDECKTYEERLVKAGVRAKGDYRENYSPGWKYNHWELKGVPIRIEIGPRDMQQSHYVAVKRYNGDKVTNKKANIEVDVPKMLIDIHDAMYKKAKDDMDSHLVVTEDWQKFVTELDKKNIIMSPFCGRVECEETIKKESAREDPGEPGAPAMGAKSLCIPFNQPKALAPNAKCIHPKCGSKPQKYTLFGRSY